MPLVSTFVCLTEVKWINVDVTITSLQIVMRICESDWSLQSEFNFSGGEVKCEEEAKSSEVVEENTNEKCNRFRTFRAKYYPYVRTTYPLYEVAIEDAVALKLSNPNRSYSSSWAQSKGSSTGVHDGIIPTVLPKLYDQFVARICCFSGKVFFLLSSLIKFATGTMIQTWWYWLVC